MSTHLIIPDLCSKCSVNPRYRNKVWCRDCKNKYERDRWNKQTHKERYSKWLKHKYKLSFEEYLKMLSGQGYKCYICSIDLLTEDKLVSPKRACVDHDHKTNKVRKILCNHCNQALGLIKENENTARKMMEYIIDNASHTARPACPSGPQQ